MPGQPRRQHDSGGAAEQREDEALGQQLPDQPSAAGAKREPHADLAPPRRASSEEEAGDIGAADEQDQSGDDRHDADEREERPEHPRQAAE